MPKQDALDAIKTMYGKTSAGQKPQPVSPAKKPQKVEALDAIKTMYKPELPTIDNEVDNVVNNTPDFDYDAIKQKERKLKTKNLFGQKVKGVFKQIGAEIEYVRNNMSPETKAKFKNFGVLAPFVLGVEEAFEYGPRAIRKTQQELSDEGIVDRFNANERFKMANGGKLPTETGKEALSRISRDSEETLPFVGGAKEIAITKRAIQAINRLEDESIPDEDKQIDLMFLSNLQDEYGQDKKRMAKVYDIISGSISFMSELAIATLTGGSSAIATGGQKLTREAAQKLLKKYLTDEMAGTVSGRLAKLGLKTATGLAQQAVVSPIAGMTRIPANTLQNMIPQYDVTKTELGSLEGQILSEGDNLGEALPKAFVEQFIETASERSGGLFNELGDIAKSQMLKLGFVSAFLKKNRVKPKDIPTFVKRMKDALRVAGWNGVLGEMFEERVADVGYGIATELGLSDQGWKMPTKDDFITEGIAFLIPGIGINTTMGMARFFGGSGGKPDEKAPKNQFEALKTFYGDVKNAIREFGRSRTEQAIVSETGATADQAKAIVDNAELVARTEQEEMIDGDKETIDAILNEVKVTPAETEDEAVVELIAREIKQKEEAEKKKEKQKPSGTFDSIEDIVGSELRLEAEEIWETKYADEYTSIYNEMRDLEKQAKEEKDNTELQAKIDELNEKLADIEENFTETEMPVFENRKGQMALQERMGELEISGDIEDVFDSAIESGDPFAKELVTQMLLEPDTVTKDVIDTYYKKITQAETKQEEKKTKVKKKSTPVVRAEEEVRVPTPVESKKKKKNTKTKTKSFIDVAKKIASEKRKDGLNAIEIDGGIARMSPKPIMAQHISVRSKSDLPSGKYSVVAGEIKTTTENIRSIPLPSYADKGSSNKEVFATVSAKEMAEALDRASLFVAESSAYNADNLGPIQIKVKNGKVYFTGTDAFRLIHEPLSGATPKITTETFYIYDVKSLYTALSMFDGEVDVRFFTSEKKKYISIGDTNTEIVVSDKTVDYPNYEAITVPKYAKEYVVDPAEVVAKLKEIKKLIPVKSRLNTFSFKYKNGKLSISAVINPAGDVETRAIRATEQDVTKQPEGFLDGSVLMKQSDGFVNMDYAIDLFNSAPSNAGQMFLRGIAGQNMLHLGNSSFAKTNTVEDVGKVDDTVYKSLLLSGENIQDGYITYDQAVEEFRKYFSEEEVPTELVKSLTTPNGGRAFGAYYNGIAKFVENPLASTPHHEAVHAFIRLFSGIKTREGVLRLAYRDAIEKKGKTKVNDEIEELRIAYRGRLSGQKLIDIYAEEYLADGFVDYVKAENKTAKTFLEKVYDAIVRFFKKLIDGGSINSFYDSIIARERENKNEAEKELELLYEANLKRYKNTTKTLEYIRENIKKDRVSKNTILELLKRQGTTELDQMVFNEVLSAMSGEEVSVGELLATVQEQILPLSMIESDTYADYGTTNIKKNFITGGDVVSREYKEVKTHIYDSTFKHGNYGHFTPDYINLRKKEFELKRVQGIREGNVVDQWLVVEKGDTLADVATEEEATRRVFQVTKSELEAKEWIEKVKSREIKQEGLTSGLFGHTRVAVREVNGTKIFEVIELQGDPHQFGHHRVKSELSIAQNFVKIADTLIEKIDKYHPTDEDTYLTDRESAILDDVIKTQLVPGSAIGTLAEEILIGNTTQFKNEEERNSMKEWVKGISDMYKESIPSMQKKASLAEKQFFALGAKYADRLVKEEIRTSAEKLDDDNPTGVIRFPTGVTASIVEGHISDASQYKVLGGSFVKVEKVMATEKEYVGRAVRHNIWGLHWSRATQKNNYTYFGDSEGHYLVPITEKNANWSYKDGTIFEAEVFNVFSEDYFDKVADKVTIPNDALVSNVYFKVVDSVEEGGVKNWIVKELKAERPFELMNKGDTVDDLQVGDEIDLREDGERYTILREGGAYVIASRSHEVISKEYGELLGEDVDAKDDEVSNEIGSGEITKEELELMQEEGFESPDTEKAVEMMLEYLENNNKEVVEYSDIKNDFRGWLYEITEVDTSDYYDSSDGDTLYSTSGEEKRIELYKEEDYVSEDEEGRSVADFDYAETLELFNPGDIETQKEIKEDQEEKEKILVREVERAIAEYAEKQKDVEIPENPIVNSDGAYVLPENAIGSDSYKGVHYYYQNILPKTLKKHLRNPRVVTDEWGLQWWEGDIEIADRGPIVVFQRQKSGGGYMSMSAGSQAPGLFEADAPKQAETKEKAFKLYGEVIGLMKAHSARYGESYTPRGANGVYYPDTENVRVNGSNNLSTAVHELSHYIDFRMHITPKLMGIDKYSSVGNPIYEKATKKYRQQLTSIYERFYPTGKKNHKLNKRMIEGFATFVQKYIESPSLITREYPELVDSFLKPQGVFYDASIAKLVLDARETINKYFKLSAIEKVGARVLDQTNETGKDSFLSFGAKIRTFLADNIYPIEILAGKAGIADTLHDPSLWMRAYKDHVVTVVNNVQGKRGYWRFVNGHFKKVLPFNWKNLYDRLGAKKQSDTFGHYLVARRAYFTFEEADELEREIERLDSLNEDTTELKKNLKEIQTILRNDQFVREEVTEAYLSTKDLFVEEEAMYDKLVAEDLSFLADPMVGLISSEEYSRLSSKKGYASFKRDFYDELVGDVVSVGGKKTGSTRVSSMLSRTGSARAIINPLFSGVVNHAEVVRKGLRQTVYNRLASFGIEAKFPELFQRLQLEVNYNPETGMTRYPQEKDENIIMGRVNGKRVPILVDAQVKNILDNTFDYRNIGVFEQAMLAVSRSFTKGTTGWFPAFALTNYTIDQVTAVAQTKHNYIPIYDSLRQVVVGAVNRGGVEGEYLTEYFTMGGERQTLLRWQDLSPQEYAQRLTKEKAGLVRFSDWINKGFDVLAIPAQMSEIGTRAAEYIKARKSGLPALVALERAGRVSAPFHHIGTWGGKNAQVFIKTLPYFNAIIQVLDQASRSLENKESRVRYGFTALVLTSLIASSFYLIFSNSDDDRITKAYLDLHPRDLSKYIFIPRSRSAIDAEPNKPFTQIRIPDNMGFIGALINMVLADQFMNANYTMGDYVEAGSAWIPQQFNVFKPESALFAWIPPLIKVPVQMAANFKDYPEIMPIENQTQRNKLPMFRYTQYTSAFAKFLGKNLNISPIKVDFLITGIAGRASGFFTAKPGVYNPFSTITRNYYFESGRRLQEFYDIKEKNSQMKNAWKSEELDFSDSELKDLMAESENIKKIDVLLDEYGLLDSDSDMDRMLELQDQILDKVEELTSGTSPSVDISTTTDRTYKDYLESGLFESAISVWNSETKSGERLSAIERDLAKELYGDEYTDNNLNTVKKEFAITRYFGFNDANVVRIKSGKTNNEKVDILLEMQRSMPAEEFRAFIENGRREITLASGNPSRILISDNLWEMFNEKRAK